MPRSATIRSLPAAFEMMKAMQEEGLGWGEDCRPLARQAITSIIEDSLAASIDAHPLRVAERGEADRRNGTYQRRILTELGDIELSVPRTCTYSPKAVVRTYARRTAQVDRMILACFVLGLSTRKVGEAMLPILGRPVSASAVSQVAKSLDAVVAAFHRRPLKNRYKVLMLDGVVLSRKTGAGAVKHPVLVALGLLPDGRKEIIDFRLAKSESAAEWQGADRRPFGDQFFRLAVLRAFFVPREVETYLMTLKHDSNLTLKSRDKSLDTPRQGLNRDWFEQALKIVMSTAIRRYTANERGGLCIGAGD